MLHPELSEKSVGKKVRICTKQLSYGDTYEGVFVAKHMIDLDGTVGEICSFSTDVEIDPSFKINNDGGGYNYSPGMLELIEEDQQPEDNTIPTEIYVFQNIVETLSKISGISKEVTKPEEVFIEIKKASPGLVGREVVCRWFTTSKGRVVGLDKNNPEEFVQVKFEDKILQELFYIGNLWLVG